MWSNSVLSMKSQKSFDWWNVNYFCIETVSHSKDLLCGIIKSGSVKLKKKISYQYFIFDGIQSKIKI